MYGIKDGGGGGAPILETGRTAQIQSSSGPGWGGGGGLVWRLNYQGNLSTSSVARMSRRSPQLLTCLFICLSVSVCHGLAVAGGSFTSASLLSAGICISMTSFAKPFFEPELDKRQAQARSTPAKSFSTLAALCQTTVPPIHLARTQQVMPDNHPHHLISQSTHTLFSSAVNPQSQIHSQIPFPHNFTFTNCR